MRALTVEPGVKGSAALEDVPDTSAADGDYLVESLQVGLCGTDAEIVGGAYGEAPPGERRLVLGHEAVGRVVRAPDGAPLSSGDLVVPVVRRPDPEPCASCAQGEWDMCLNGRYTEHGITRLHGFARDSYALDPRFAVAVPASLGELAVLVEPASVVAKAWEQVERIASRSTRRPRTAAVVGAGPIGLLATLMGVQRGLEVHTVDLVTDGPKPRLVSSLGATYHHDGLATACDAPDVIIECTGVGAVVLDAVETVGPSGIVCLAGLSSGARKVELSMAELNRQMVLENVVVFGTVNANLRHYRLAVEALDSAGRDWLEGLVTRRVPVERWQDALDKRADDVKVVLDLRA